jgi:endo-1,4-beta-xylanase
MMKKPAFTALLVPALLACLASSAAADWKAEANSRIEQLRKSGAVIRLTGPDGSPLASATVDVIQARKAFPFGSAMSRHLIGNPHYREFFRRNFNWAVFENESKWYANERERGQTTYADADAMLAWCRENDIPVRGHCVFWEPERWQPRWVPGLSDSELKQAVESRLESVVKHFKGRFLHWDVNNEMLHGSFFKDRLGEPIWAWMFKRTRELDPEVKLFVNEFNILSVDQNYEQVETEEYVRSIRRLREQGAPIDGVGIQGHVWYEDILDNPHVIRQRLDIVAELGLPIWISEFDVVDKDPAVRADKMELVYRTAYSHPAVEGIMLWLFWAGNSWRGPDAAMVNLDWTLNAQGERFQALMKEWSTDLSGQTDASGRFTFRGFHGSYQVKIQAPGRPVIERSFELTPGDTVQEILLTY